VEAIEDYAIFMLDPKGLVATWNAGAERIKGYRADEIMGEHFSRFYPPAARTKCEQLLATATSAGRVEDEGWRVRKDGSQFWANVIITSLRDSAGNVIGFAKITRDMTHRRGAEERLRESEERFRLLVEAVGDYAIYMLDPQDWSPHGTSAPNGITGYRTDEIMGQPVSAFTPRTTCARASGRQNGRLRSAPDVSRKKDGGSARMAPDSGPTWSLPPCGMAPIRLLGFAKVTRDLTERRAAEEERLKLGRLARQRVELLAGLSESLAAASSIEELGTPSPTTERDSQELTPAPSTCSTRRLRRCPSSPSAAVPRTSSSAYVPSAVTLAIPSMPSEPAWRPPSGSRPAPNTRRFFRPSPN
jgi:PAS domain S-box-containing protein